MYGTFLNHLVKSTTPANQHYQNATIFSPNTGGIPEQSVATIREYSTEISKDIPTSATAIIATTQRSSGKILLCVFKLLGDYKMMIWPNNQSKNVSSFCRYIQGQVALDCSIPFDKEVTLPGTIVTSPNYPLEYESNQDCAITIAFNNSVSLMFLSFDVEYDENCAYDYLNIFDGPSSNSPLVSPQGKLCGGTIPSAIVTAGNMLHILFHSDGTTNRAGFDILAVEYDRGKGIEVFIYMGDSTHAHRDF